MVVANAETALCQYRCCHCLTHALLLEAIGVAATTANPSDAVALLRLRHWLTADLTLPGVGGVGGRF